MIPKDVHVLIPGEIFFFKFFLMWTIFKKSLLNVLQYCFCFMFCFFGHEACGVLAPWPGIEPTPPALEGKVLTTGPPGKRPTDVIKLGILRWGSYLGLSGWSNVITGVLVRGRQEDQRGEVTVEAEDGAMMGHKPRNAGSF